MKLHPKNTIYSSQLLKTNLCKVKVAYVLLTGWEGSALMRISRGKFLLAF